MTNSIYFVAGKGGSGKDTIIEYLSKELSLPILPVHTTRTPRPDDKHNVFHTLDEMLSVDESEREMRGYLHVEGYVYYATYKSDADREKAYLATGPSEMYNNFLTLFPDRKIVPIIIDVSFDNRIKRMHGRDMDESIRRARADDAEWKDYFVDKHVVNGNQSFWAVASEVQRIIEKEMSM